MKNTSSKTISDLVQDCLTWFSSKNTLWISNNRSIPRPMISKNMEIMRFLIDTLSIWTVRSAWSIQVFLVMLLMPWHQRRRLAANSRLPIIKEKLISWFMRYSKHILKTDWSCLIISYRNKSTNIWIFEWIKPRLKMQKNEEEELYMVTTPAKPQEPRKMIKTWNLKPANNSHK